MSRGHEKNCFFMAEEGVDGRGNSMDLNLYLGLPRPPPTLRFAGLGTDLALTPAGFPPSAAETVFSTVDMPGTREHPDSHPPYSPSHALLSSLLPAAVADGITLPPADLFRDGSSYSPPPAPTQHYNPYYAPFFHYHNTRLQPVSTPYTPPYMENLHALQEADGFLLSDGGAQVMYEMTSPPMLTDDALDENSGGYLPSFVPISTSSLVQNDVSVTMPHTMLMQAGTTFAGDVGPSSSQDVIRNPDLLHNPEFRLQRLIDSNRRVRARRFRFSHTNGSTGPGTSTPATSVPQPCDIASDRLVETTGKGKLNDDGVGRAGLEHPSEDRGKDTVNFECNICLDIAKEPVVTPCGHLFCWPCLYQWLHLHSVHKECPVCKGEVVESNVTPIYGRGSSEVSAEGKNGEASDTGLKIPPRPRGNRVESLRQQMQRPFSRSLVEEITGLLGHRFVREGQESVSERIRRVLTEIRPGRRFDGPLRRLRARRVLLAESLDSAANSTGRGNARETMASPHGADARSRVQAAMRRIYRHSLDTANDDGSSGTQSDIRASGLLGTGASTSVLPVISDGLGQIPNTADPQISEQLIFQPAAITQSAEASASSTLALMQGDAGAIERNNSRSSRAIRRSRRWNEASGASDMDGDVSAAHGRRELS